MHVLSSGVPALSLTVRHNIYSHEIYFILPNAMKYFIISDIFHPLFSLINYFGKISKIILLDVKY